MGGNNGPDAAVDPTIVSESDDDLDESDFEEVCPTFELFRWGRLLRTNLISYC